MRKEEKIEFVKGLRAQLKACRTVAVLETGATPDRLVQKVRNQLKPDAKFVVARRTLLDRAVAEDETLKRLLPYLSGNVALILTNKEPAELNRIISENRIRLPAKPHQTSPEDISVEAGDTTIALGQAVTDLKAAGIDVQIQKGKVVISKGKVIVAKGAKVSVPVSKALKMLDIAPFEARTKLRAALDNGLLYTEEALGVDRAYVEEGIARIFAEADALSTAIGFVTPYNVAAMIRKAYISAIGLGVDRNIYEPEIVEKLLAKAVMEALEANRHIKPAAAKDGGDEAPAAPDGAGKKEQ